jgi:hypothetical protein
MAVPVAAAASTLRPMGQGNATSDNYGLASEPLPSSRKQSWEAIETSTRGVDARQVAADRMIAQAKADGQKQLQRKHKDSASDGDWGGASRVIWIVIGVLAAILQIVRLNHQAHEREQQRRYANPYHQPHDRYLRPPR